MCVCSEPQQSETAAMNPLLSQSIICYPLRNRPYFTSVGHFLTTAGVRPDHAEVFSLPIDFMDDDDYAENPADIPFMGRQEIHSLLERLSPPEVFLPDVLFRWAEYLDDPWELAWAAWASVPLFDIVGGLDDHADEWVLAQIQRSDGYTNGMFWKFFETNKQQHDKGERFAQARRQLGFEFTPGSWHFHGATSNSAISVLDSGTGMSNAHIKQDFTDDTGFYTCEDYEDAKAFAIRASFEESSTEAAVLAYFVPDEKLCLLSRLDLENNPEVWERLVIASRTNQHRKIWALLESLGIPFPDMIRGAICANPREVEREEKPPLARDHHLQTAFCSQSRSILSRLTCCAVFFKVIEDEPIRI